MMPSAQNTQHRHRRGNYTLDSRAKPMVQPLSISPYPTMQSHLTMILDDGNLTITTTQEFDKHHVLTIDLRLTFSSPFFLINLSLLCFFPFLRTIRHPFSDDELC